MAEDAGYLNYNYSVSYHIIHLALEPPSLPPSGVPGSVAGAGDGGGYNVCSAHTLQRAAPPDSIVTALEVITAGGFPERAVGVAVNDEVPSVAPDGAAGSLVGPFVARLQRGGVVGE